MSTIHPSISTRPSEDALPPHNPPSPRKKKEGKNQQQHRDRPSEGKEEGMTMLMRTQGHATHPLSPAHPSGRMMFGLRMPVHVVAAISLLHAHSAIVVATPARSSREQEGQGGEQSGGPQHCQPLQPSHTCLPPSKKTQWRTSFAPFLSGAYLGLCFMFWLLSRLVVRCLHVQCASSSLARACVLFLLFLPCCCFMLVSFLFCRIVDPPCFVSPSLSLSLSLAAVVAAVVDLCG